MQESLRTEFTLAEQTFISALSNGIAMEAFDDTWSKLQDSFPKAKALDSETLFVVYRVATTIQMLAGGIIGLHDNVGLLTKSFRDDLDAYFAQLSIHDDVSPTYALPVPAYIKPAYEWLLANLHNPYPSRARKAIIAEEANVDYKEVENWFMSIRKRIGWNSLRSKYFSNKRSLIVDAATRWFKSGSTSNAAGSSSSIVKSDPGIEFVTIENAAKCLYARYLSLLEESNSKIKSKCYQGSFPNLAASYPSAEQSHACSPEPCLLPSLPVLRVDQDLRITRKRRQSTLENSNFDREEFDSSRKRQRCISGNSTFLVTDLPSPPASISENEAISVLAIQEHRISQHTSFLGKRKRSVSDAGREDVGNCSSDVLPRPRCPSPNLLQFPTPDDLFESRLANNVVEVATLSIRSLATDLSPPLEIECHKLDLGNNLLEGLNFETEDQTHALSWDVLPDVSEMRNFAFDGLDVYDRPSDMRSDYPPMLATILFDHKVVPNAAYDYPIGDELMKQRRAQTLRDELLQLEAELAC